jgi:hypothetical protein
LAMEWYSTHHQHCSRATRTWRNSITRMIHASRSNGETTPQKRRLRSNADLVMHESRISSPLKRKSPRRCVDSSPNTPTNVSVWFIIIDLNFTGFTGSIKIIGLFEGR